MNTIMIADDNRDWAQALADMIAREDAFRVVAVANDGRDALAKIEAHRPDIIILDIVMPEYDGTYIAKHARTAVPGYQPALYILSGMGTDAIVRTLNELNIDFFNMKPVVPEVVLENLRVIARARVGPPDAAPEGSDIGTDTGFSREIREILLQLGLTPNRPSTLYSARALSTYLASPDTYGLLTKVVYPAIAEEYTTSVASVERNIRSAITQMVKKNTALYRTIFAYLLPGKVTNNEFLSIMADYIRNR